MYALATFKRDDFDGGSWTGGARWAFFAIFAVLIIVVVIGTLRVNRNRARLGHEPIYGTRWMTPPLYLQLQGQYNQPTRRDPDMPNVYVPTYTAHANEYDMGYYDAQGNFVANPNAKDPAFPEQAHQRTHEVGDGVPASDLHLLEDVARPVRPSYDRPPDDGVPAGQDAGHQVGHQAGQEWEHEAGHDAGQARVPQTTLSASSDTRRQ